MKNWPSLAWWLIDMCIVNAFTLRHLDTKANITQLDFRRALLRQILDAFPPSSRRRKRSRPPPSSTSSEPHYPKHSNDKRDCAYCSAASGGRKRGRVMCDRCDKHLCLEPCFREYHEGL